MPGVLIFTVTLTLRATVNFRRCHFVRHGLPRVSSLRSCDFCLRRVPCRSRYHLCRPCLRRTEICFYSGFRIYPGHGRRYVRSDGRHYVFLNSKCESSFLMRRKAAKHSWTQLYRRLNKKGIQEEAQRRRTRRKASAVPKAVEGAPLEVIKAKRSQRPEVRKAARDAALKDIKDRKTKTVKKGKQNFAPSKTSVAQRR
jgi:large subunit ribosomal protein L24e